MLRRRAFAPAFAVLAALALAACTPGGGVATPTPTELTEEQAYAAAEDAFRAYIAALNQIDVSNPETFEPAFALTTNGQNSRDRSQYSGWHAEAYSQVGEASVPLLEPLESSDDLQTVHLAVCLDVSRVDVLDSSGISVVNPDRVDVQTLDVAVEVSASGLWQVAELSGRGGDPVCT